MFYFTLFDWGVGVLLHVASPQKISLKLKFVRCTPLYYYLDCLFTSLSAWSSNHLFGNLIGLSSIQRHYHHHCMLQRQWQICLHLWKLIFTDYILPDNYEWQKIRVSQPLRDWKHCFLSNAVSIQIYFLGFKWCVIIHFYTPRSISVMLPKLKGNDR